MSKECDEYRIECLRSDTERDKNLKDPDDVISFDDICYGDDKEFNVLDVYKPKDLKDDILPVIVSVHGGAWVYGNKEIYRYYCMSLAKRGFAVVNFTYRLAPESKFPASTEDTNSVFDWVLLNADKYGFDINNIFAVGDSAGANILGVYANIVTNKEFAKKYFFKVPEGLKLKGIALNCGKYDMEHNANEDERLKIFLSEDYLPNGGTSEELSMINVNKHVTKDFPPTVIMSCPNDFLLPQVPLMINALMENAVPCKFFYYGNKENPLWHVFHVNVRLKEANKCNDEECEFFKSLMKD